MTDDVSMYIDGQPVEITLTKGQRGSYGWDVKVKAKTLIEALEVIDKANELLTKKYATVEASQ